MKCESRVIDGYEFRLTCPACPEQYDVFKDGKQVAYLRLRHGYFSVEHPDCGGEFIYEAEPEGGGRFTEEEREKYILDALQAIEKKLNSDEE